MGLVGKTVWPEERTSPSRDPRAPRKVTQSVLPLAATQKARDVMAPESCRKGPTLEEKADQRSDDKKRKTVEDMPEERVCSMCSPPGIFSWAPHLDKLAG